MDNNARSNRQMMMMKIGRQINRQIDDKINIGKKTFNQWFKKEKNVIKVRKELPYIKIKLYEVIWLIALYTMTNCNYI